MRLDAVGRSLGVLRRYRGICREEWLDHDSLEKLQKERLGRILEHSYRTDHYRRIMDDAAVSPADAAEDMSAMPVTRKESLRLLPGSFLKKGVSKDSLFKSTSSGSTGDPVEVYLDDEAECHRIAVMYHSEILSGRSPFEMFAYVSTLSRFFKPGRFFSMTGLFPRVYLSILKDEEKNLELMRKHRAKMLMSFTSALISMARANQEKEEPLKLKSILSRGEVLTEEAREMVEDSFSCNVFDRYGSVEFPVMANECPEEHKLHVNAGSYLLEIVDENGKPAESGEIVVTHLLNKTMPMLRYSTGDRGRWGKCSCGRSTPVLESVEGRANDFIILPSGKILPAISLMRIPFESSSKGILRYQIIQEREDLMVFRYMPIGNGMPRETKKRIEVMIRDICNGEAEVEFEEVDRMPLGRTGKLRSFVSKLKQPAK